MNGSLAKTLFLLGYILLLILPPLRAEDGYRLWLRYDKITDATKVQEYKSQVTGILIQGQSPTLTAARQELSIGLSGLLGIEIPLVTSVQGKTVIVGTPQHSALIKSLRLDDALLKVGAEGYLLLARKVNGQDCLILAANADIGVLYGAFHFLKLLQTRQAIHNINLSSAPRIKNRILNHWDNLDRTVERGYAGFSIWDWHKLPDYIDARYRDYARANASIGINGTVLTNVNANALVLTEEYLVKVAALANAFRPYGLKVYLTARFSAPIELGGLKTADPLEAPVKNWWKNKADEIYRHVPDFGGFLVKANSEGQPGPQNYSRTHADGANMLADAVAPHGGIVMWRAFVYDDQVPDDRAKQAYNEFKPLDGTFRKNVLVQVKNGPIDFQPREPFHPLFGAMPKTPLMLEFQLTQEYLGFATHLVYLATLFKETLAADTYAKGQGSLVAKVVAGTLNQPALTGIAGVANIGNDRNWTGHPFGQANWYAFGRLAWNPESTPEQLAEEWLRMTFTNQPDFVKPVREMMLASREMTVNYMTPLGLHHLMGYSHHFGPGPWVKDKKRADWTSVYYHKADAAGIGFDRTASGSNALSQYFPPVQKLYGHLKTCPEEYLLWFHHVRWEGKVKSGRTLWEELCARYYAGVDSVGGLQKTWRQQAGKIDEERYQQVKTLLAMQQKEAKRWRNACVLYFQTFSKKPIPPGYEPPDQSLEYYQNEKFSLVPGN